MLASLGALYAMAGKKENALAVLIKLERRRSRDYIPAYYVAGIHAQLRSFNQAFHWLDKALEERSSWMTYLAVDPLWDPLREDPRFQELISRTGLAG